MTIVGAGGVILRRWRKARRFHRDYCDLDIAMRDKTDQKLQDLVQSPIPPGLRFEKLKGYSDPSVYSIHVTGNYKITFEIESDVALLRRVGTHDDIDRQA